MGDAADGCPWIDFEFQSCRAHAAIGRHDNDRLLPLKLADGIKPFEAEPNRIHQHMTPGATRVNEVFLQALAIRHRLRNGDGRQGGIHARGADRAPADKEIDRE